MGGSLPRWEEKLSVLNRIFPISRSFPALRFKSRSRGRRRDGRKRSGSKQSSVLEAMAVVELSDSVSTDNSSPVQLAQLEDEAFEGEPSKSFLF